MLERDLCVEDTYIYSIEPADLYRRRSGKAVGEKRVGKSIKVFTKKIKNPPSGLGEFIIKKIKNPPGTTANFIIDYILFYKEN